MKAHMGWNNFPKVNSAPPSQVGLTLLISYLTLVGSWSCVLAPSTS